MITADGKHCTVQGIIVWEGVTRPDTDTPVGKPKWSCKIVVHPQQQDLQDFVQLATTELNNSEFQGQLPPGANWAISPVQANDAFNKDGRFNGYMCINGGTYQGAPQVFDANGNELQPMAYSTLLYTGCMVDLLLNAYAYNNKQKGIAAGLGGLRVVDATAERLNIGGGIDAGSVFGNQAAQGQQPAMQQPAMGNVPAGGVQPNSQPVQNMQQVAAPGATTYPSNVPVGNVPPAQNVPGQVAAPPVTGQQPVAQVASSAPAMAGSPAVQPNQNYLP